MLEPSAFKGAVNAVGLVPDATSRVPVVAGSCQRIAVGTVNVFCPAVVRQMNSVEVVVMLVPVPELAEEMPTISTRSVAFPPVQLSVSGVLRFTEPGKPPVTVSADARVRFALKDPTSRPPAPLIV